MRLLRLLRIFAMVWAYGLDDFLLPLRWRFSRRLGRGVVTAPRGERLRLALESLGPIFVKFGQLLSTRRDLIPTDIADQLALLQDRVAPFPSDEAVDVLERAYKRPLDEVFASFERKPVASASVAQVHFAVLPDGREVAVKILRPGIASIIASDVALMHVIAALVERIYSDGKRLKPRQVVAEFEKSIAQELDLMFEAANASQLRRNFEKSRLLRIPEIYWDWCERNIIVMQRMSGTPISQVATLREKGIDIPRLAREGVEIFFTQVFRDGFFHADMHPGNIMVADDGTYIALDFGIVGTLSDVDKNYLARNFLAFFRRDYRGWRRPTSTLAGCQPVPASTSSSRPSALVASRSSTARSRKFRLVGCCCACSRPRASSRSRSSRSWCCCKRRFSISRVWAATLTLTSTSGPPPNRFSSAG